MSSGFLTFSGSQGVVRIPSMVRSNTRFLLFSLRPMMKYIIMELRPSSLRPTRIPLPGYGLAYSSSSRFFIIIIFLFTGHKLYLCLRSELYFSNFVAQTWNINVPNSLGKLKIQCLTALHTGLTCNLFNIWLLYNGKYVVVNSTYLCYDILMPNLFNCNIIEHKKLTHSVYSISVDCEPLAQKSMPGQFLHIKCGDKQLLRRPISICSVSGGVLRIVFEVKGEGTQWLASAQAGESLSILGPLGKGFSLMAGNVIVVGGGIGSPPMLYAAMCAKENAAVTAILGFRSAGDVILKDDFEKVCDELFLMTDDGSAGEPGQVTLPLEKLLKSGGFDAVLSCGPHKMQEAVAKIAAEFNVPCQVSMEERMGCGVGACLVCACAVVSGATMKMSRVCADGPVYDAREIYG